MVAIDEGGHDHDGGELCPTCQFRQALADLFQGSAEDGPKQWHYATGDLTNLMHNALWALNRLQAESFTDEHDLIDNAGEAARSLVDLANEIEHLRHELLADDEQHPE